MVRMVEFTLFLARQYENVVSHSSTSMNHLVILMKWGN